MSDAHSYFTKEISQSINQSMNTFSFTAVLINSKVLSSILKITEKIILLRHSLKSSTLYIGSFQQSKAWVLGRKALVQTYMYIQFLNLSIKEADLTFRGSEFRQRLGA